MNYILRWASSSKRHVGAVSSSAGRSVAVARRGAEEDSITTEAASTKARPLM